MRVKIFRWKAIGPLLLFLGILTVLVILFAEPVARDTTEEASTEPSAIPAATCPGVPSEWSVLIMD